MKDVFKIKTVNHTYGEVYVNAPLDRESVDRYLLKVRWIPNVSLRAVGGFLANIVITANLFCHVRIKQQIISLAVNASKSIFQTDEDYRLI